MFKSAFDCLVQGVYIVSSCIEDEKAGLAAAWLMQSSFKPAMLAVALGPTRKTAEVIEKSKKFAVQVLDKKQKEIGELFGYYSSRNVDKFSKVRWFESEKLKLPIVEGVIAYFECELVGKLESGDHVIYNGLVVNHKLLNPQGEPMIFSMRDWF
ncbi:flavin reductase family protein [Thermotoga caldifontis]|uniref:flavin reductase family protein n=1 Tax=Thermotoga caldifontis TaxID=1508419 RepID=UPI000693256A|nr:flavin reductase family protein [Thermotoga caldifontis]